ncbi:hypothetical protein UA45_11955 [Morganella morganii]|uniref:Uncharacterized protein n=1 Tax=Morganella morganii TaxID=582 RepID=A0A0D8L6Q6_MORMO|nr:hypothetical protein UA45_11955 [Morganella morganii]
MINITIWCMTDPPIMFKFRKFQVILFFVVSVTYFINASFFLIIPFSFYNSLMFLLNMSVLMSLRSDLSAVILLKNRDLLILMNVIFPEFQENGFIINNTDYLIVWLPERNKSLTIDDKSIRIQGFRRHHEKTHCNQFSSAFGAIFRCFRSAVLCRRA